MSNIPAPVRRALDREASGLAAGVAIVLAILTILAWSAILAG